MTLSFSCVTLTQIALYVRVDKENSLESSLIRCTLLIHVRLFVSGPVGQSRIPLRGYEVKTRRTRQSFLYELPSYLYNYKWLC